MKKKFDVDKFIDALVAPPGMTKTRSQETIAWGDREIQLKVVRFATANDDLEIKVEFYPDGEHTIATGHVSFDTVKGRRTFDRIGVDDSFYVEAKATVAEVNALLLEQVARVAESRARLATCVTVPQYGYNLTPDALESHRATLRAGRAVSLAPAGFGVGHRLSARALRFGRPAPQAVSDFFGVGRLYVEEFDHD